MSYSDKDLADLVGFINHGNTPIRQQAIDALKPFSITHPNIFKTSDLLPVKNLKLLVRDYPKIARDVLDILINLTNDRDVLADLSTDDVLLEELLTRLTNPKEPNADSIAMLLANLAKEDNIKRLLKLGRGTPEGLQSNDRIIDQLLDLFVKGSDGSYNPNANFDYLCYLFADIAKHDEGRKYFVQKQAYDGVIPLTKLTVFTSHKSNVRRKGVASVIKNVAFETDKHPLFFDEEEVNILPYLLLPLVDGADQFSDEDTEDMLDDLQLLEPDKERERDAEIVKTHLETLMLLTTTRDGRDILRRIKVYPVVRELHLGVEDEGVREACERLVQVLMRDEEGEEKVSGDMTALVRQDKIVGLPARQPAKTTGHWEMGVKGKEDSEDEDDDIQEV